MMWHRRETRRQTENTNLSLRTGSDLPTLPILKFLTASDTGPPLLDGESPN
ncbi:MAG: hypothetical protein ACREBG_14980 [Pyrinomonadaceae bacterium]